MKRSFYPALLVVCLSFISISCDNHVHDDEDHEEAVGLFIRSSGVTLVEYRAPNTPIGGLSVSVNDETDLLTVTFIAADGDEFSPTDSELNLGFEVSNSDIFEIEQHDEDGKWRFHVLGKQIGTATLVLKLNHNDHADFRTLPITITVSNPTL